MAEWSRFATRPDLGVDLLHAHFERHAYDRHAHDFYAIGVFVTGAVAFRYRAAAHVAPSGAVLVLEPGEAHDGRPAVAGGFTKRMLYVQPATLGRAAWDDDAPQALPAFPRAVLDDPWLARRLVRLHAALADPHAGRLEQEGRLVETLAALTGRHAEGGREPRVVPDDRVVRRVRDYLHAHAAADVSLADLAREAGVSRFRVSRLFQRAFGLPPHAYLVHLRLAEARRRLAAGEPPAEVAAATGFADQSHLTRRFRGAFGITPGQFRAACTDIQSRRPAPF